MQPPLAAETLSELIGSIYDCAVDPGLWPTTLTGLRQALDFKNAALTLMALPSGAPLLSVIDGVDPPWLDSMLGYSADVVEQWGGAEKLQALPLNEPAVLSWVNDRANWAANRYFVEWAVPQGIIDVMAIGLSRDTQMLGSIGMGRHASAGAIGEREVDATRLLIPHLQRAVAITRLLELRSLAAQTFKSALDALPTAVVLVDADLRIVDANNVGQALLDSGDLIRSERGRLVATSPTAAAALAPAVRQAGENESEIGRRGFGIPARRADGAPCVLHVLPLQRGALRPGLAPSAAAAIFIAPAASPALAPSEALAALFDLTAAEGRVLSLLAAGMTLSAAARELGVRSSTVRTHLLRLFAKTGTHRQTELIRLTSSLTTLA